MKAFDVSSMGECAVFVYEYYRRVYVSVVLFLYLVKLRELSLSKTLLIISALVSAAISTLILNLEDLITGFIKCRPRLLTLDQIV